MKRLIFIFSLIHLFGCVSHSQKEIGRLIIDTTLENKFSDGPLMGTNVGPTKVYIDSVLVYSSDSSTDINYYYNAHLRDLNGNHFPFDTCKCSFSGDTLIIEFTEISAITPDKVRVKVIDKNCSIYFVFDNSNKEIITTSQTLVINREIIKRGQEILGDVMFQVLNSKNNKQYSFRGSFICTVE